MPLPVQWLAPIRDGRCTLIRPINQHSAQNQQTAHYVLPVLADVHQGHTIDQNAQKYHADQRASDFSLASYQAGTADDYRGDDIQLLALGRGRRARLPPCRL